MKFLVEQINRPNLQREVLLSNHNMSVFDEQLLHHTRLG